MRLLSLRLSRERKPGSAEVLCSFTFEHILHSTEYSRIVTYLHSTELLDLLRTIPPKCLVDIRINEIDKNRVLSLILNDINDL